MDDKLNLKDRILKDVGKSVKMIQQVSIGIECSQSYDCGEDVGGGSVNSNSWLVQSLCCHIDLAIRHGLREPLCGFWPLLRNISHSNTFQAISGLHSICSPLGKGLVWLHHTLVEGSLQSYLQCLIHDKSTLQCYYTSKAILRDSSCTQQLITLLAGLENISFIMSVEKGELQDGAGFSGLTSMTSSLSSPVDSGVALLDSDADVTSTNGTTITEGDAVSLKEDETILVELEDNRINDSIVSQGIGQTDFLSVISRCMETEVDVVNETESEQRTYIDIKHNGAKANFVPENSVEDVSTESFTLHSESASNFNKRTEKQRKIPISIAESVTNKCPSISSSKCNSMTLSSYFNDFSLNYEENLTHSCPTLEGEKSDINEESCRSNDSLKDNKLKNNEVMSKSMGAETTVVRRPRKKNCNGPDVKIKRVSFHEDLLQSSTDSTSMFSASFLPPNPVIKCDVVKGRYSWCAEGDSPYFEQRRNCDTRSDVFLSTSTPVVSEENNSYGQGRSNNNLLKLNTNLKDDTIMPTAKSSKLPPVTERGIPEGQEDPPKASSLLRLNSVTDSVLKKFPSIASSIDWSSDTESDVCDRVNKKVGPFYHKEDRLVSSKCQSALLKFSRFMSPSKTSLFKRFMKSITERKYQRKTKLQKFKPLYIPGAKPDPVAANQYLGELETIYAQMNDLRESDCIIGSTFKRALPDLLQDSEEVLYKVFKVHSSYSIDGKSEPLIILLGANSLYFIGIKHHGSYCLYLMMKYSELDAIIVGPSRQTLLFTNRNQKKQILVTSNNRTTTGNVVGNVEVAMRKSSMKLVLPTVWELCLEDMKTLKLQLSRSCMLSEDEDILHYSIIHLHDNPTSPPSTPLGPEKEGHLMFRAATDAPLQSWEPGYFILKGGVVYMFHDQENRLPKRVIPIYGGQCQGFRRIVHELRPHTFEIILGHKHSFQFAAADEYETSEWLQVLVQAASGFYEKEKVNTLSCSLIITSRHIITCQENFLSGAISVLTCAAISDLLTFSILSSKECWCVLEFACHEVRESSGDWAVYFSSPEQMLLFKRDLEELWKRKLQVDFPLRTINNVTLCQICEETSRSLSSAWDEVFSDDQ